MHASFFFILISPCVSPTIQLVLISSVEAFIGVELLDLVLNQFGDLCQHVGSQLVLIAESAGNDARALSVDALQDSEALRAEINVQRDQLAVVQELLAPYRRCGSAFGVGEL